MEASVNSSNTSSFDRVYHRCVSCRSMEESVKEQMVKAKTEVSVKEKTGKAKNEVSVKEKIKTQIKKALFPVELIGAYFVFHFYLFLALCMPFTSMYRKLSESRATRSYK